MAKGKAAAHKEKIEKIAYPNGIKNSAANPTFADLPPELKAVVDEYFKNGLSDALGFPGSIGFPQNQGTNFSAPLSNVNTIFTNLRWYLISNMRQVLCQAYVELGLIQTIVDVPVDDALRGGIEIKSKQLDETQLEELQTSLDRDDDIQTMGQAAKWNRLFGGGGVIIMTDQDPESPLDLEALTKDSPLEFRAVDMWELYWDQQNTEGFDPELQTEDAEFYSYYAVKIHKSRVMKLKGMIAPSFIRPRLRGWGFSVVETLVRSINQYLKATDLSFEVLDEFKLDVYKIKNLVNTLISPNGKQKIQERVQLANWQKNYQNAVVMDAEDDFDHKQLSFAGLGEAMDGIRMQIAADMRMPRSKLFGEAGGGLNNGGNEGDLEVYNSMVEAQVRNKIKYNLLRMCEVKCQQLFGMVPDDLSIKFKPLRVMSAEQDENVKTQKFTRLIQAKQQGEITTLEFRDACNRGNLFDITLDTTDSLLNPDDPEVGDIVKEGANDPDDSKDSEDPGADRADSRTPSLKKKENKIENVIKMPNPYTPVQRMSRILFSNSTDFDKASYAADGGDDWIHPKRELLFENPPGKDLVLWEQAKEASMKAFGKEKWQYVVWFYKKLGGRFN